MAKTITEQQRKVLSEVEAAVAEAIQAGRQRLEAEGFTFDETDSDFECLLCDCDMYKPGYHGNCRTPGCNHGFFSHRHPE